MKPGNVVACLLIACPAQAQTDSLPRTPVPDPRPLLVAAIEARSGEAHGVLRGDTADLISKKFQSTSPIFIDVTTEKRYALPGCSRLSVRFWQDDVLLPGAAARTRQTITFGINYCRNGQAPRSLS